METISEKSWFKLINNIVEKKVLIGSILSSPRLFHANCYLTKQKISQSKYYIGKTGRVKSNKTFLSVNRPQISE